MAELKLPRLLQAAKEFNVGQDTLIVFLINKGFPKDDLKATSKLTEEMYRSLQLEFSSDKAAKMKSDQVDLPKGALAEAKKKKEDEEISFQRKEEKPPLKIVKKEEDSAAVAEEKAKAKAKKEEPKKEPEIVRQEIPEIESPKVIDKIDLSTVDSSTRPKKITKKAPEAEPAKEETVAKEKPKKAAKESKK